MLAEWPDVYKGEDTLLGRPVAIKILHSNFASDDEFVSRFKREAQAAGKLNHPNIVNMYDVGYDQGMHYINYGICRRRNT